jgi:hypothetical protein
MVGIDFYDLNVDIDINNQSYTEIIEYLCTEFKQGIDSVCEEHKIQFQRNEDDERFSFYRKYFASALKLALLNDNPNTDETYKVLITSKVGLEKVYYIDIVVQRIINKIHDKFFLGGGNFYSFVDRNEPSFAGTNSRFGIKWDMDIDEAINPNDPTIQMIKNMREKREKNENNDGLSDVLKQFADLFAPTWINEYEDRISVVYNVLAIKEKNKRTESINSLKHIAV